MISTEMSSSVLVVDDDIAICRIIQAMLAPEQYRIQTINSVSDALAAIEQSAFDVYVMDYKLQDGSGLDVAEGIRSKWGASSIILISGYDRSFFASRAEKLGITQFIEKPFSRETICSAVKKAIGTGRGSGPPVPQSPAIGKKRIGVISRILSRF
jgi:two-component system nitrogen regulation response regulator GlnG